MTNAVAQASRNAGAASDIQNADASSARVVLKEGRLPVSKDKAKNTIDVGLGHTDVTKTDAKGRATEITVTVDTTNISNTWASGNRSEVKTDVEVVAHEIKHVNNQLTPEAQAKTNANPDAEEQEALDAGEAAANDPATEKKPTDEEKNKASTVLGPKK